MKQLFLAGLAVLWWSLAASAQEDGMQSVLQAHREVIVESSRKSIGPAIDAIAESGLPQTQAVLETWAEKDMWVRLSDGLFFRAEDAGGGTYRLTDFDTGQSVGTFPKDALDQLKPNSGIRAMIASALVRFQLLDPDPAKRRDALTSIERDPGADLLDPLRASIADEPDPDLRAQKERLERLLTISFDPETDARIDAIKHMSGDLGVDARATLNPLVATTRHAAAGSEPGPGNLAAILTPGADGFSEAEAFALLVDAGMAPPRVSASALPGILAQHIDGGRVGGVPLVQMDTDSARRTAFRALVASGAVPALVDDDQAREILARHVFYDTYAEPSTEVTDAALAALATINLKVGLNQALDLALDALSLASIYFLAAIGLAITFGVMGVINMAHGEFIMMGAYTGYVVQQIIPDHTLSIIVAIPAAFAVTFAAGVAMERLVIRWLYARPLETLLATFGISIALQQLAKTIFGTQARPLTSPGWLDGALALNDVVSISYIRIAIFILALIFLGVFLFIMKRTRLGLETRAVTQNPRMAASMGINPGRVNMLTFGLGSGIAGVAGVAIGLFAKVTSELGSDYIVQSFMTVVVGGVGNIWGTLAGAAMIGFLQKGIEWLNPSNTLAAQTYMIVFIIIFIQFRPRGIIALKGRAAAD
ncbi:urea ABC transporter permease subunit UrtB [Roseivivax sp. CAU 1753]